MLASVMWYHWLRPYPPYRFQSLSRVCVGPAPSHVVQSVFACVGDGRDGVRFAPAPPHPPSCLAPLVQGFLVVLYVLLLLVPVDRQTDKQKSAYYRYIIISIQGLRTRTRSTVFPERGNQYVYVGKFITIYIKDVYLHLSNVNYSSRFVIYIYIFTCKHNEYFTTQYRSLPDTQP